TVNSTVGSLRNADLAPVATRLAAVEQTLGALRNADLDPIAARLGAVEQAIANFHIPATDLRPLHASMIDLERAVLALDKPAPALPPAVDLAPLHNRLAALQASLAGLQTEVRNRQAIDMLERRLASLQEAVQGIPEPDLSPVMSIVHSMESRIDLGAL